MGEMPLLFYNWIIIIWKKKLTFFTLLLKQGCVDIDKSSAGISMETRIRAILKESFLIQVF